MSFLAGSRLPVTRCHICGKGPGCEGSTGSPATRRHPLVHLSCSALSQPFSASMARGEALLRFPYDERLRGLLRAIPGRRWDPEERVWCLPLEPEQAQALALLLADLPGEPQVSEALARAIERRRG